VIATGLPCATSADALPVDGGDLLGAVGVDRDDVERRPVDALERHRGVGDLAPEPRADHGDGLGEEVVDDVGSRPRTRSARSAASASSSSIASGSSW
jgi:hypothetical protein